MACAFSFFQDHLLVCNVLVETDMVTVAYINHQGSSCSPSLNPVACAIAGWAERHLLAISAQHICGVDNGGGCLELQVSFLTLCLSRRIFSCSVRCSGIPSWTGLPLGTMLCFPSCSRAWEVEA